jgi:hypothetical protein
MADKQQEQAVSLTAKDLQQLIATAIAAAKQPNEIEQFELEEKKKKQEQQKLDTEQEQQTRRETAEQQLQIIASKKSFQRVCTHKHRKGDSHCVFVTDDLGGYILCQKCQAVIRSGSVPKDYNGTVIYDTDLFNRLFQDTSSNGVWD